MNTQHAPLRPFAPEVAIENISFAGHAWKSRVLEQIALPSTLSLRGTTCGLKFTRPGWKGSRGEQARTNSHDESAVSGEPGYYET
jgi:hypothetical protein